MDIFKESTKSNNGEIVVGFDLTDDYAQISYGFVDGEGVETLSTVSGGANYLIPMALFKRKEVNQWFVGKEAVKNNQEEGFFIDRLIEKAVLGADIEVGDMSFRPAQLIALFLKRSLSLITSVAPLNRIVSVMISVPDLDTGLIEVLSEAVASLNLKTDNIFFQNHTESFYYYTIYQPTELWQKNVLLLDFSGKHLKSYRMECNKNTTPIVAFIDSKSYLAFTTEGLKDLIINSEEAKNADINLCNLLEDICGDKNYSAIYFIGENFRQEIFRETIRYMCRKARVFEGNNLYSKGAAFSAKNKIVKTLLSESHVFLGNEKLKANVGLNVLKNGEAGYMPLLDAGVNWYEAKSSCQVILDKGNKVSFVITPLTGKNPEVIDITLGDLPKRPVKTSRIKIDIVMLSEDRMQVTIKDMGFGELFPSSEIEWKEEISL